LGWKRQTETEKKGTILADLVQEDEKYVLPEEDPEIWDIRAFLVDRQKSC